MKKLKLVLLIALMALTAGMSGCASDGSNGAKGANGTDGLDGTPGADAPVVATAESCAVCHGANKLADIAVAHPAQTTPLSGTIDAIATTTDATYN